MPLIERVGFGFFWGFGFLGYWGIGVLGYWGIGVLGFWGFGVLGFWGFGVLGFWGGQAVLKNVSRLHKIKVVTNCVFHFLYSFWQLMETIC